jgi:hypothetical protein
VFCPIGAPGRRRRHACSKNCFRNKRARRIGGGQQICRSSSWPSWSTRLTQAPLLAASRDEDERGTEFPRSLSDIQRFFIARISSIRIRWRARRPSTGPGAETPALQLSGPTALS